MTVRFAAVGAALALSVTLVACEGRSTTESPITTTTPAGESSAPPAAQVEERDNALVRVVHAVPAGAAVDLYADDRRVFDGLDYKDVTAYREVPGERFTFAVRAAGAAQSAPLATSSEGLDDGDHYTAFAVPGDDSAAMLRVVKDDQSLPAAGKTRVRVVHASKDAGQIDIIAAGVKDPLFDGVNFQSVSNYSEMDPVAGTITLRSEGTAQTVMTVRDVRFDAGKSYTLVVVGNLKAAPKLDAFVIEDAATGSVAGVR